MGVATAIGPAMCFFSALIPARRRMTIKGHGTIGRPMSGTSCIWGRAF